MNYPRLSRIEAIVLELLAKQPLKGMYGMQMVQERPDELKLSSIYVTLKRMHDKGYVKSELVARSEGGRARRVFTLTRGGAMTCTQHRAAEKASQEAAKRFGESEPWII